MHREVKAEVPSRGTKVGDLDRDPKSKKSATGGTKVEGIEARENKARHKESTIPWYKSRRPQRHVVTAILDGVSTIGGTKVGYH